MLKFYLFLWGHFEKNLEVFNIIFLLPKWYSRKNTVGSEQVFQEQLSGRGCFSAQRCLGVAASSVWEGLPSWGRHAVPCGENLTRTGHRVAQSCTGSRLEMSIWAAELAAARSYPTVTSAPSGWWGLSPRCRLMCFCTTFDYSCDDILKKILSPSLSLYIYIKVYMLFYLSASPDLRGWRGAAC